MSDMQRKPFSDEIRDCFHRSGRTVYNVAAAMGVAPSTVHRFVHGQNGLSLALLDRLADVLDIHATIEPKRKGK
jgi:plasmid maintenance system antidote protein VapI